MSTLSVLTGSPFVLNSYTGSWGYQLLRLLKPSGFQVCLQLKSYKPDLGKHVTLSIGVRNSQ
jgi:hypothetical protein